MSRVIGITRARREGHVDTGADAGKGSGPATGAPASAARRGRPPATSSGELRRIALRLFIENGFEATTIDQITTEAGVSERTFFRYFTSKSSVLWIEFDAEVDAIRAALAAVPDDLPMMEAIRWAVVSANHYQASDVPELRMRMNLIASVPVLSSSAAEHYDAWQRAAGVGELVPGDVGGAAQRRGQPDERDVPLGELDEVGAGVDGSRGAGQGDQVAVVPADLQRPQRGGVQQRDVEASRDQVPG